MRAYTHLRALARGETVEVQGIPVRQTGTWEDLAPGDTYVGERNTVALLTVKRVDRYDLGCVFPEEPYYPFDLHECVKVEPVWPE